ncbi:MAG: MCE family protein [Verrucomicrobia bacterium]|nr:MCE family protein [Verrucomicrobiota bacterium]
MPIQDLTPQLRTRLSRVEKVVGIFILAAALMMLAGLAFYLRTTAKERGWFLLKAPYYTYLRSGGGIREGDKVKMMGFDIGEITKVEADDPLSTNNVYVEFVILGHYSGYVWSDSTVNVKSLGLLGSRYLEVNKGDASGKHGRVYATYKSKDHTLLEALADVSTGAYKPWEGKPYMLPANEPPEIAAQMDEIVQQAKDALPFILALTNSLTVIMANTAIATERVNNLLNKSEPVVLNLETITSNLKNPKGALGEWLILPQTQKELDSALTAANQALNSANTAVTNVNAQLTEVAAGLDVAIDQLGLIMGNLRQQVDQNTNVLSEVSTLIVNTDDMVQGLKRHWLLRSAFRKSAHSNPNQSTNPVPTLRPREGRR